VGIAGREREEEEEEEEGKRERVAKFQFAPKCLL